VNIGLCFPTFFPLEWVDFFSQLQPLTFGVGRQCLISHFNRYLFRNW
jgi:hypothetical protein